MFGDVTRRFAAEDGVVGKQRIAPRPTCPTPVLECSFKCPADKFTERDAFRPGIFDGLALQPIGQDKGRAHHNYDCIIA